MPKVIIDCDPGIDDALALLLALASPELDVAGITTVSGNVPADMGARNAKKVLRQADRQEVPVYIGEMTPLGGTYVDAMDTHGRDGLGESFLPEVPGPFPQKGAVEFLEECLERGEISILALGPMTNLARLFERFLGCSTYEYLTSFRINKAKGLLITDPHLKIQDIARLTGFSSVSHFITMFKRTAGVTPLQFRKLN